MSKNKRDLLIVASLLPCLGALAYSTAATTPPSSNVLRVQRLEFVDDEGAIKATITTLPEGWPGIIITDGRSPSASITVGLGKGGLVVDFREPRNRVKAGIVLTDKEGGIHISKGLNEGATISFGIASDGLPYLSAENKDGKPVLKLP